MTKLGQDVQSYGILLYLEYKFEENPSISPIAVGDAAVGKTSLLNCYVDGSFGTNYVSTIGIDFRDDSRHIY